MATPRSAAEFLENFPPDDPPPERLLRLMEFVLQQPYQQFSGAFALERWPYGRDSWMRGNAEAARRLVVFGQHEDNNSLYAFWRYDDRSVRESPIVYLHTEGWDNRVLANNFDQFLALLTLDIDEIGTGCFDGEVVGNTSRNNEFLDWLYKEFEIVPPDNPQSILEAARDAHPDLQIWIDQQTPLPPTPKPWWRRLLDC